MITDDESQKSEARGQRDTLEGSGQRIESFRCVQQALLLYFLSSIICHPSSVIRRLSSVLLGLTMLFCLNITGCCTKPKVNAVKPVETIFIVHADKLWQDSGIYVTQGQIIQCSVEGQWHDLDKTYGPDGNNAYMKDHLGINAPAKALLMRFSSMTNEAYIVGSQTNITAEYSGYILFRNNVLLPIGVSGELKVTTAIAPDADGDGLSDYEEVHIWHTDPLRMDSDNDGFSDLEEISDRKAFLKTNRVSTQTQNNKGK